MTSAQEEEGRSLLPWVLAAAGHEGGGRGGHLGGRVGGRGGYDVLGHRLRHGEEDTREKEKGEVVER